MGWNHQLVTYYCKYQDSTVVENPWANLIEVRQQADLIVTTPGDVQILSRIPPLNQPEGNGFEIQKLAIGVMSWISDSEIIMVSTVYYTDIQYKEILWWYYGDMILYIFLWFLIQSICGDHWYTSILINLLGSSEVNSLCFQPFPSCWVFVFRSVCKMYICIYIICISVYPWLFPKLHICTLR